MKKIFLMGILGLFALGSCTNKMRKDMTTKDMTIVSSHTTTMDMTTKDTTTMDTTTKRKVPGTLTKENVTATTTKPPTPTATKLFFPKRKLTLPE